MSQILQENNCATASFSTMLLPSACAIIKKETLTQVLSCEFCEIFKKTYSTEHRRDTVNKQALKQTNSFLLSNSFS